MGQCADRDVVYTTNGRVDQNCLVIDAAGHFELARDRPPGRPRRGPRRASCCRAAAAARRRQRLVDLRRVAHLDRQRQIRAAPRAPAAPPPPRRRPSAEWFSLIRMKSNSPMRWLTPPPCATARFSSSPQPGRGLARVEDLRAARRRTERTMRAVLVATPESRPRKFSAVRSAVSSARAEPSTRSTGPALAPLALGPEPLDRARRDRAAGTPPRRRRARRSRPGAFCVIVARARAPGVDGGLGGRVSVADVLGERSVDQLSHAAESSE